MDYLMIEVTAAQQSAYRERANMLKGSERRRYMASVVQILGRGGQRYAESVLGWNRRTVRKGMAELTSGISQTDHFAARGRKRSEERLPHLLEELRAIADAQRRCRETSGTEPGISGVSATAVRRALIAQKIYPEPLVPALATIRKKLIDLGYQLHPARTPPTQSST